MAALKPIKTRRHADADVVKLRCNCGEQSWHFRITMIGNQVVAECAECLADWGPFFVSPVSPVRESDEAGN